MAMDMLKLSMLIKKSTFTNAGNVTQKESFMYMNPRWLSTMMLLTALVILTNSCTRTSTNTKGEFNPITSIIRLVYTHGN